MNDPIARMAKQLAALRANSPKPQAMATTPQAEEIEEIPAKRDCDCSKITGILNQYFLGGGIVKTITRCWGCGSTQEIVSRVCVEKHSKPTPINLLGTYDRGL